MSLQNDAADWYEKQFAAKGVCGEGETLVKCIGFSLSALSLLQWDKGRGEVATLQGASASLARIWAGLAFIAKQKQTNHPDLEEPFSAPNFLQNIVEMKRGRPVEHAAIIAQRLATLMLESLCGEVSSSRWFVAEMLGALIVFLGVYQTPQEAIQDLIKS